MKRSKSAEYRAAVAVGERERRRGLHATRATFDRASRRVILELTNGYLFGIPLDRLREIRDASSEDLADVEVYGGGSVLHWETLDADYSIPALVLEAFKTRHLAQHMGRAGGLATSRAKARAARKNGALGGRPKAR